MLAGKSKGRSARRQEDNIKMYLEKPGCERVGRMHVARDEVLWLALVNTVP